LQLPTQSKIDELLTDLIGRWGRPDIWNIHEDYYLNDLAPRIVEQPGYGDERELQLHKDIKNELTDAEWLDLPALIREKREGRLRETEKECLNRLAKQKAQEKKKQRLAEEEKVRREKALAEAERKRLLKALKKKMEEDYLSADVFFTSCCQPLISVEEYEKEKISFVRNWAKVYSGTQVDSEQALAIGAVDRHVQVVARAGSGKTTTIAVRAAFMIKHCGINPTEMLLLAFNRKAAEEMADRLSGILTGTLPHVMTFHALAYAIVHPEESLLYDESEGAQSKSRALQTLIDDHMRDPDYRERIRNVMMTHFRSDWERIVAGGFERSKEEFLLYRRSLPRETLQGQYVKSFGEKIIADFLFEHDVPYKYERNFWWSGINYRPDFTLFKSSNSGIVIEYFGLSGDPDYDEMSREKEEFWSSKTGWTLLSFTPHNIRKNGEEAFRKALKDSLEKLGFGCNRLSEDEIWHRVRDRAIDRFTTAVVGFVQRCRKRSFKAWQLTDLARNYITTSSVEAGFLDVVLPLYEAYLNRIASIGEDDFDGLMQRASQAVSADQTQFKRLSGSGDLRKIQHICIDEYQDFSELFHQLVEAIRKQNPSVLFFCVGDDWQAINGFAGSDLRFYENFQKQFKPSGRFHISTNYRSCTGIVEIGNALMDGMGKSARAAKHEPGEVLFADLETFKPTTREVERHFGDNVTPAVLRLTGSLLEKGQRAVLLSRKNSLPYYVNYKEQTGKSSNRLERFLEGIRSFLPQDWRAQINVSTAHKFKGLQESTVIILDAVGRSYPLIHPDWVFTRVLGNCVEDIIDEEKRLFYVSLTRAVNRLIILSESGNFSPFLEALFEKMKIPLVKWEQYPPVKEQQLRVTVKVGNQEGAGVGPTLKIKDQLKAEGYQWTSTEWKSWCRTCQAEGFSIKNLCESSVWIQEADGVEVRVYDDYNCLMERCFVDRGKFRSGMDKPK